MLPHSALFEKKYLVIHLCEVHVYDKKDIPCLFFHNTHPSTFHEYSHSRGNSESTVYLIFQRLQVQGK